MGNSSLISVVIACYNDADYIARAVDSVCNQTYSPVELIVVDDGSDDGSLDILHRLTEAHPGRVRLYAQSRKGPYPARNLDLTYASGDYVAFLDADDWWREDCLEKLLSAISEHGADLAYCGGISEASSKIRTVASSRDINAVPDCWRTMVTRYPIRRPARGVVRCAS